MVAQADKSNIIDPNGIYFKDDVAALLGINTKTVERRWQADELPRPFYDGRRPCWTGAALLKHFEKRQAAANEFAGV